LASEWYPPGWKIVKLGEIGKLDRGRSRHRPRHAPHLYGGKYPFVQTGDIKASCGRITNYEQTYSEAGLAQSRLWPAGTLAITIAATIAETGILTFPACFPDSVVGFIADETKCNVYFVEYMFRYMRQKIQSEASGSVQDNINLEILNNLAFPLPPLPEQRAIARILGELDDKIELNRRMNRTLEALAQALFQSWFVDFDPVIAKAEGRLPFGMSAETAALFPAEFVDSELGAIPKGWRIGIIDEVFNLVMGQSPPGKTYNEIGDGITFYQGRTDFGSRYPKPRIYCTAPTRFANPGDTLVSVRAPVGDINMALEKCCIGRGLASIRHKNGNRSYTYYAMHFLRDDFDVFEGEGTLFGSISGAGFRNIKIVVPAPKAVTEFERLVSPLDQAIENNEQQIVTLASIRDALLPRLLSGDVRVNY
jgi:type I restriction enzyme S subunit